MRFVFFLYVNFVIFWSQWAGRFDSVNKHSSKAFHRLESQKEVSSLCCVNFSDLFL